MSYILEALRKADQMRRRGDVPGLDVSDAPVPAGKTVWPARAWFALVVVNLILVAFLLWPETERPVAVGTKSGPKVVGRADSEAFVEPPDLARNPVTPMPEPTRPLQPIPAPIPAMNPKTRGSVTFAPAEIPVPGLDAPATASADSNPPMELSDSDSGVADTASPGAPDSGVKPAQPAGAGPEDNLPVWPQVPPSLFAQLPDSLRLDVHVYANNPAERFVLVNLKKYREGDTLSEGPVLESITPEGVVLSFRGQRFRVLAK